MKTKRFTCVAWWQYWKQLQMLRLALGHLNYTGFIPKINDHATVSASQ